MNAQQTLLFEVERFLELSGMAPGTFGHEAVNDGKLVGRLRNGSSCTLKTAERIRQYISENSERFRGKKQRQKCVA